MRVESWTQKWKSDPQITERIYYRERDDIRKSPTRAVPMAPLPYHCRVVDKDSTYGSARFLLVNPNTGKQEYVNLSVKSWSPVSVGSSINHERNPGAVAWQQAIQNCFSDVMDLAETLADADKTISSGVSAARAIYKSIRFMKNKEYRKAFKELGYNGSIPKKLATTHLQYMFMVRPFMDDVNSAIGYVANPYKKKLAWGRSSNREESQGPISKLNQTVVGISPFTGKRVSTLTGVSRSTFTTHEAWASVCYEVQDPVTAFAFASGALNVPLIAWNRTAQSFVFDWAINVSGFLRQFNPGCGVAYRGGSITRKATSEVVTWGGTNGKSTLVRMDRSIAISTPFFFAPTRGKMLNLGKLSTLISMSISETKTSVRYVRQLK